jgi:hypothetical protein
MLFTVLANRHGAMDFSAVFAQNLDIGQFCLNSWPHIPPRHRENVNTTNNQKLSDNSKSGDGIWV